MTNQRSFTKTMLKVIALLLFFPIAATYFLVKSKLPKAQKIGAIVALWVVFIGIGSFADKGQQTTTEHTQQVAASPTPTTQVEDKGTQDAEAVSVPDKIKAIVHKFYEVDPAIMKKDLADDDLSKGGLLVYVNLPLNHDITSCKRAKQLSYRIIEALYKDEEIRPRLLAVRVIVPSYLRTSLSYKDGVPMAEKGGFSGPTNYWRVIERDQRFQVEDESVPPELRSYGIYLKNCKQQ